jgi:hypothetical protein
MRMQRRRHAVALALAAVFGVLAAGGCSLQDAICRRGEYPVKAVGNATGRACVADNEDPPEGYVRYPAGKVPKHVDDKWDKYWSDKIVDKNGAIVG